MTWLIGAFALAAAQAAPAHYDIHARLDLARGSIAATTVVALPVEQAQGAPAFSAGRQLQDRAGLGRPRLDVVMARLGRRRPRTTADFIAVLSDVAGPEAARAFEAELRT